MRSIDITWDDFGLFAYAWFYVGCALALMGVFLIDLLNIGCAMAGAAYTMIILTIPPAPWRVRP